MKNIILFFNIAIVAFFTTYSSFARTGAVDKFKESDFGWRLLESTRNYESKKPDFLKDYCGLAGTYEHALANLDDVIERGVLLNLNKNNQSEIVYLSEEEIEELRQFYKRERLGLSDADRRCRT